jgi:hypothetical protein
MPSLPYIRFLIIMILLSLGQGVDKWLPRPLM